MAKNKAAQELVKKRNKLYGKNWLKNNASKASQVRWSHSASSAKIQDEKNIKE
jgi:hypothetical protein